MFTHNIRWDQIVRSQCVRFRSVWMSLCVMEGRANLFRHENTFKNSGGEFLLDCASNEFRQIVKRQVWYNDDSKWINCPVKLVMRGHPAVQWNLSCADTKLCTGKCQFTRVLGFSRYILATLSTPSFERACLSIDEETVSYFLYKIVNVCDYSRNVLKISLRMVSVCDKFHCSANLFTPLV